VGFPATRNIKVYKGDGYAHRLELATVDDVELDFTDGTFAAQWRPARGSDTHEDFTVDATDAATGVVVLHLTAEQTTALRKGEWDVQFTPTGAEPLTFLQGTVRVENDVTRT
jgi:hypothetical protein